MACTVISGMTSTLRLLFLRQGAAVPFVPKTVGFVILIVLSLSLLAQLGLTCSSLFPPPGLVTLSIKWSSHRAVGDTLALRVLLSSQLMVCLDNFFFSYTSQPKLHSPQHERKPNM